MEQQLVIPTDATGAAISLRPQTEADEAFLKELYASVRWAEMAPTGWPDGLKHAFLEQQRNLQTQHYLSHYAGLWRGIVLCADKPVGRLYLWRNGDDLRIVELSLLAAYRQRGVGSRLLRAVQDEAGGSGARASLHVDENNPARRLYQRLGFRPEGNAAPPNIFMIWRPGDSPLQDTPSVV